MFPLPISSIVVHVKRKKSFRRAGRLFETARLRQTKSSLQLFRLSILIFTTRSFIVSSPAEPLGYFFQKPFHHRRFDTIWFNRLISCWEHSLNRESKTTRHRTFLLIFAKYMYTDRFSKFLADTFCGKFAIR